MESPGISMNGNSVRRVEKFRAGVGAIGAVAVGAVAVGGVAFGALAIGRLVIGSPAIHKATLDSLNNRRL